MQTIPDVSSEKKELDINPFDHRARYALQVPGVRSG
jgi:hypothetical protein